MGKKINKDSMSNEDVDSLDQSLKDDQPMDDNFSNGDQRRGGVARVEEANTEEKGSSDSSFLYEDDNE